ncbi:unnamed protein product [Chilo suppressalis]|uniref:Partial AB-hydrolase lipase domain-containing protein n=1 Tax=Chilo suppressalis TaxID=168631 RepID=A0ABN8B7H9_CHISP|nr:unnamed protein product [Chilo suppressalis]
MKFLIVLVAVIYHYQSVDCLNAIDYLNEKLNDLSKEVVKAYNHVTVSIKNIFTRRNYEDEKEIEKYILEEKIKQSFNDFVEKSGSCTQHPDYLSFRSEPTALMSTPQLATLHGRRIESHIIKTKDNYLLTLHRVFNGSSIPDRTVILHHGLMGSSADWIMLGPTKSLPYILSDAGYDVWMCNARGNYYSRGHLLERVNSSRYWKFSFQEMGEYDLPAVINYVKKFKPIDEKINFIGHSMGTSALLVMLSTQPRYNEFLRMGILLAPLAFMSNAQGPIKMLTTMANRPPNSLLKVIGDTEYLPSRKMPKMMASKFCTGPKLFCGNPLLFLAGGIREDDSLEESFLARLLYHVPAGASTNTILHYGQLAQNGKFHRFGDSSAEFHLHNVRLPIVLVTSTEDWLATVPDVMRLYFNIVNPIDHYVIRGKNLTHTEFVWGADADVTVFSKVLELLVRGTNRKSLKENEV